MSSEVRAWSGGYLATVGVFDGLHLGHRAIIRSLLDASRETGLPAILYTFDPRPVAVFAPATPADELTPFPRKIRLLAEAGLSRVTILRFSHAFARVEPEDFLVEVLGVGNGLRGLWVGHDFRFGHLRRGDWAMIQASASRHGFRAVRIPAVEWGGAPLSSSRIREALRRGEVEEAAAMLGRWPDLEGTVVAGRGDGKRLLVPTANLDLPSAHCLPAPGVYGGEAEWDGEWRPAVMNLGRRPTFGPGDRLIPEVHVLDLDRDLTARRLLFRVRRRLREERKFPSVEALREQIFRDVSEVRRLSARWATTGSDGKETDLPAGRVPDSFPD